MGGQPNDRGSSCVGSDTSAPRLGIVASVPSFPVSTTTSRSTSADTNSSGPGTTGSEGLPFWFVVPVLGGLCLIAATATVGVGLADVGLFLPSTVVPVVALATALCLWSARPLPTHRDPSRTSGVVVLLAMVIAAGSSLVNGYFASEHLLTNRDPAVYNTTAAYLASNGELLVDTDRFDVFGGTEGLSFSTAGYNGNAGGEDIYPQFLHGLPALLAVGDWVGGSRLMLRLPAIFGGLGLLTFFAVAQLWVRRWLALVAMSTLALTLPQVWFSRDAFSEIPSQALVLGALWLTVEALRRRQSTLGLLAGLLLGATLTLRIDSWALLLFVPALYAMALLVWGTPSARSTALRLALGVVPGALVGTVDLFWRSAEYARDLSAQYTRLSGGVVAAGLATVLVALLVKRFEGISAWFARFQRPMALSAGTAVTGLMILGYLVRPSLQTMHGGRAISFVEWLQEGAGQPLDGTRMYGEDSLVWQSWYVGRIPLLLAAVGLGLLVWSFLAGRKREYGLLLALLAPMTVLFLYKPSINPDQLWAMRRFLVTALPLLVLAAAISFESMLASLQNRTSKPSRSNLLDLVAAPAAALLLLWVPIGRLKPVLAAANQDNVLGLVESSCRALPENSAVIVITEADLQLTTVAPFRSICEVPVAWAKVELGPVGWRRAANKIRSGGRTPVVLAKSMGTIHLVDPKAEELGSFSTENPNHLEQLLGVPDQLFTATYSFTLAELAP